MIRTQEEHLAHYGILRKSGRYPWGSGGTQDQRNRDFLAYVDGLRKEGMSEAEIARGVRYGLSTGVYTRDLDRALELARNLDTGLVRINQPTSGVDFHVPFGGEKSSGFGPREQGRAAREFYTSTGTILIPRSR